MESPVKRRYDSSRRKEAAAARRTSLIAAARHLFSVSGYSATTIEAIAEAAGVSAETVYLAFKTKAALLAKVVDVTLAGDEASLPLAERPLFQEARSERDQVRQVRLLARNARIVLERAGALQWTLLLASGHEPEIAELVERYGRMRLQTMTTFIDWIAANGPLRAGLTKQRAAETYWTLSSTEVHHLMCVRLGYSADDYEEWLGDQLERALLPPQAQGRRNLRGQRQRGPSQVPSGPTEARTHG